MWLVGCRVPHDVAHAPSVPRPDSSGRQWGEKRHARAPAAARWRKLSSLLSRHSCRLFWSIRGEESRGLSTQQAWRPAPPPGHFFNPVCQFSVTSSGTLSLSPTIVLSRNFCPCATLL